MKGNPGSGPESILKKGGNTMKPIKESATHYGDSSDDYYSSGKENNDMNYSQNLEHSFKTMTMSQKDPNRAPMIIPDLC